MQRVTTAAIDHTTTGRRPRRRGGAAVLVVVALLAATLAAVVTPAAPVAADGNEAVGAPLAARSITAGGNHTCAILPSGAVKCWGRGSEGQLGQGSTASLGARPGDMAALLPVDLGAGRTATAVTAGGTHTCALLDNGTVKCWGAGGDGRLGQDSTATLGDGAGEMAALLPVNLGAGRTATAVTAADKHTCALLDNGTVKCWGAGSSGQLGQDSTATLGDGAGEMAALLPVDLGAGRTATAVTAAQQHTCALLDNGTVKCWGAGSFGRLGQDSTATLGDAAGEMAVLLPVDLGAGRTATAVTAAQNHTCALLDNGTVKCWGSGFGGQLGQDSTADLGDQAGEMAALTPVNLGAGRTATAVTAGNAGGTHTCALLDNGTVKCWGVNSSGQLGQGSNVPLGDQAGEMAALGPVELGLPLQVVLTADELSVQPGEVIHYHLTITNNTASAVTGVTIADPNAPACVQAVPDLTSGQTHTVNCSFTTSGADFPSRANTATVDTDQTTPLASNTQIVYVGIPLTTATAVSVGSAHTCAVSVDGTVKCWGLNSSGQLGQGSTTTLGDSAGEMAAIQPVNLGVGRTATAVSAGTTHTCALLDNGTVKCWGSGTGGRLGQDSTVSLGDEPGEMAALAPVNLGAGRTATAVSAGESFTCALLDDSTVKCWGGGANGRLGQDSGVNLGDSAGEMAALPAVNLGAGRTATAVSAGIDHACALLDNGTVKCWGNGNSGQLGQDSGVALGDQAGEMAALPAVNLGAGRTATAISAFRATSCAVLDNGTLKCWGLNNVGQLGQDSTVSPLGDQAGEMAALAPVNLGAGRTATAVTAGFAHTCARLDDGTVKCWGDGSTGRLGQDSTANLGDQAGEMAALAPVNLGTGRTATRVSAGQGSHTCALLDNATVKCWGLGSSGQLGQNSTDNLGDAAGEMAALAPIVTGLGPSGPAAPGLSVTKSSDETTVAAGATVHLHVTVANTGDVGLNDVTIDDPNGPDCEAAPFDLAVGADRTVDCTYVTGGGDVGTYTNTASVTSAEVTTPVVSNQVDVTVTPAPAPALTVTKTADETTVAVGATIHLHVVVANTGNVALNDVTIDDPNGPDCEAAPFDLAVGADHTVDCTHTATAAEVAGGYHNTASVTSAEVATPVVSNTVDVTVTIPPGAGLVSGTVTETGSADPIAGAVVAVLSTATFAPVAVATANASGAYALVAPAGTYFVYAIDPTQGHAAGFSGAPTAVAVTAGNTVTANAALASIRGTISGTVTDTGGPLAGVLAMSVNLATGQPGAGDLADNTGAYAIPGLAPGPRLLEFIDLSATHPVEFYDNAPQTPGATILNVTGAGTITADADLATQAGPGTAAHLTGQVTSTVGGNLEGVAVLALRTSDFGLAAADLTDGTGSYDIALDAGTYKLAFYDPSGTHLFEWHDNLPASPPVSATTVTATAGTPLVTDAALTPTTGVVSGAVTETGTNTNLANVFVIAINASGAVVGGTTTAANGTYTLTGLPVANIRIRFVDLTAAHTDEYYDNAPDYAAATLVPITAGSATPNTNAALTPSP